MFDPYVDFPVATIPPVDGEGFVGKEEANRLYRVLLNPGIGFYFRPSTGTVKIDFVSEVGRFAIRDKMSRVSFSDVLFGAVPVFMEKREYLHVRRNGVLPYSRRGGNGDYISALMSDVAAPVRRAEHDAYRLNRIIGSKKGSWVVFDGDVLDYLRSRDDANDIMDRLYIPGAGYDRLVRNFPKWRDMASAEEVWGVKFGRSVVSPPFGTGE